MFQRRKQQASLAIRLRLWWLVLLAAFVSLGYFFRMVHLTYSARDFYLNEGQVRSERQVSAQAKRGEIIDRHGQPLALNWQRYAIGVSPKVLTSQPEKKQALAEAMGWTEQAIEQWCAQNAQRRFVYLTRQADNEVLERLQSMRTWVSVQRQGDRYYPLGEAAGQLVGNVDWDNRGVSGLENQLNKQLAGQAGEKKIHSNRKGEILTEWVKKEPIAGETIQVTIDGRLQEKVYQILASGVAKQQAEYATALVVDVPTGEILAAANYPSYDPNQRPLAAEKMNHPGFSAAFEPGSTLKPLSLAYVLSHSQWQLGDQVDTGVDYTWPDGRKITDVKPLGKISVKDVIVKSSNIGIARLVDDLARDDFHQWLTQFGFGSKLGIFAGEAAGRIVPTNGAANRVNQVALSYGYGIAVTPLQLAQAYHVVANGGNWLPLTLTKRTESVEQKRLITSEVVSDVVEAMTDVVEGQGSGVRARNRLFATAGKTGTAHYYTDSGYNNRDYVNSFVGFAPADQPKRLVVVVMHRPGGAQHFASQTTAPLVKQIMMESMWLP